MADVVIPGLLPAQPFSVYRGSGPGGDVSLGTESLAALAPPGGVDASRFMAPPEPAPAQRPAAKPMPKTAKAQAAAVLQGQMGTRGPGEEYTDEELLARADARLAAEEAAQKEGQGGAPLGNTDVYSGQMGALEEAYALLELEKAKMGPVTTSAPNPKAPIVRRRFAERQLQDAETASAAYDAANPFVPEPYQPLPPYEGESEADWQARNQIFADADMRSQLDAWERKKADYLANAGQVGDPRDIGRAPGAPGMEEALRQGTEQEHAAQVAMGDEVAREEAIAAQKQADATTELAGAMDRQRQHEQEAQAAVQHLQGVRDQARKALAAMPQVSRERVAKGLSTGTKLAALFGAIAQGWKGDAITAVNDAIDKGVAEEIDKYTRRQSEYQDTVAQADEAMNYLDFVTNSLGGNVRAGESLLRQAKIEDAIAELRAKESAAKNDVVRAQLVNVRIGLEQRLRDETDALELEVRTTPSNIVRTWDPFRAERRQIAEQQKELRAEARDVRKDVRGAAEKATDREHAFALERAKAERAAKAKNSKHLSDQAYTFGKDVEKIDTTIKGINALLDQDDIRGYGFTASPLPESWTGEADTNAQIDLVLDELARLKSGAAIGQDEWEMYDSMLRGGTTLGGEERLRRNLERVKTFLVSKRDSIEKGMDPEARSYYRRNAKLADFDPEWTGGTEEAVVEED